MKETEWKAMGAAARADWVRARAGEGHSGTTIAIMAGVTRNVILGIGNRSRPQIKFHGKGGQQGVTDQRLKQPAARYKAARPPQGPTLTPTPGRAAISLAGHPGAEEGPLPAVQPPPEPILPPVMPGSATIETLKAGDCHFPMFRDARRHPEPLSLPYCGVRSPAGSRYCAAHRLVMYRPA